MAHDFAGDVRKLWSQGIRRSKGDKERINDYKHLAEYSERFLSELPNLPIYRERNRRISDSPSAFSGVHREASGGDIRYQR